MGEDASAIGAGKKRVEETALNVYGTYHIQTGNMNLLISTPQNIFFSVAIGDSGITDFKIIKKEYSQSELLLKTIEELIKKGRQAKQGKQGRQVKIKNIYVVEGPGAFSALRVGIATANALAYSLNAPVFGVCLEKDWESLAPEKQLEKIWNKGLKHQNNKTSKQPVNQLTSKPVNRFVRPFYGQEPHITSKRETTRN